jgi:peptide/nickel transport system substrate-binding protein
MEKDSSLQNFAAAFNSNEYSRNIIEGAGPYRLDSWEVDQFIKLVRKDNWWGDDLSVTNLYNEPGEIIFRVIKDDQTAINLLHEGGLDIMAEIPALSFEDLKKDSIINQQFNFYTPSLPRYYYLGLNTRNPELEDKDVRRALAHVIDVDAIISNLESGFGTRTIGFINPSTPYYNKALPLLDFSIEKAKNTLKDEGWGDQDKDGIIDKIVDGKFVEMELDMVVSGSQLGQQIALLFQQSAKEIGIQINIDTRDQAGIRNAVNNLDFDVIALAAGQAITPPDPYQSWHTDNDKPGAGNRFGFGNARSDSIIEAIREELNEQERNKLYKEFQEILYDEQPVIFLYNPQERIIVNKNYEGIISSKRPGYFAGSFKKVRE